jgi:cell division transport system permease protein
MAFLSVFALALSLASGRLATRWGEELAQSSTVRISAPSDQLASQTEAALRVLSSTKGVASARALTKTEQQALLEPWLGPDVPVDTLPVPQLIEVIEAPEGYDVAGLRLRLLAEVAGAVVDDHTRWRRPLVRAAARLRLLAWLSIGLIGGLMAAMITLAANATLAANTQVIAVLRLIGATDMYITGAFVRRFTSRALFGACIGTAVAVLALVFSPSSGHENSFLTGLGFQGFHWILPAMVPFVAAAVAFVSTRAAASRALRAFS